MRPLLLFLLPMAFCGCQNSTRTTKIPSRLSDSTFYNIDSVRAAMNDGNDAAARKLLASGLDVSKNSKDISKSIPLFKAAILLKPTAQAYYELGSTLLDEGSYDESVQALKIAEKLDYAPLANVMARLAANYSRLAGKPMNEDPSTDEIHTRSIDDSLATHYMEVAIQMGYPHPEDFRDVAVFGTLKSRSSFLDVYNDAVSGSGARSSEELLWDNFLSEFTPVELPLVINLVWVQDHPLDRTIDYDYERFVPEMRTEKFTRDIDKQYYYYALIKKDPAYTALLYSGKSVAQSSETMPIPQFFLLVTYDRTGKIIDKIEVAGQQKYSDPYKVFTMQANHEFEVQDFKNVYKNDPAQAGYDSNEVVRTEPQGASYYRIAANGKFEKTSTPLAMR